MRKVIAETSSLKRLSFIITQYLPGQSITVTYDTGQDRNCGTLQNFKFEIN